MTPDEKIEALYEMLRKYDMPAYPLAAKNAGVSYTDYLSIAHNAGPFNEAPDGNDYVYTPHRNRQCSLGWHEECADPHGATCGCICHQVVRLLSVDE